MKKIAVLVLALIMVFGSCFVTSAASSAPTPWDGTVSKSLEGEGTEEKPFLINNGSDLAYLAQLANTGHTATLDKYFKLTADIDLNNISWTSIGNGNSRFTGHFDGNNKTVYNLMLDKTDINHYGLFGAVGVNNVLNEDGTQDRQEVFDLTVIGKCTAIGGVGCAGGVSGRLNCATMKNVVGKVDLIVTNNTSAHVWGGLVGLVSANGVMENCVNLGKVQLVHNTTNDALIGGIAGYVQYAGWLNNNYNYADISVTSLQSKAKVGGIAGYYADNNNGHFSGCQNFGDITAESNSGVRVGGILGEYSQSTVTGIGVGIKECVSLGNISAGVIDSNGDSSVLYSGGFVGWNGSSDFFFKNSITTSEKLSNGANPADGKVVNTVALNTNEGLLSCRAGASTRATGTNGIRFTTEYNAAALTALKEIFGSGNVTVGTLVSTKENVEAVGGLFYKANIERSSAILGENSVTHLDIAGTVENVGGKDVFHGAIMGITPKYYNQEYCGVGYIAINLENNISITICAEFDIDNARSLKGLAQANMASFASGSAEYSFLNEIVSKAS